MRKIFGDKSAGKIVILSLALGMYIGMCYFGSVDYLKQSVMDILVGGASCATNCNDTSRCPAYASCPTDCDECSTYTSSNPLSITGWPTPTFAVTYTNDNDEEVTLTCQTASKPSSGVRIIDYTTDYNAFTQSYIDNTDAKDWNHQLYQLHHIQPRFMNGANDYNNAQLMTIEAHQQITGFHNQYTGYCKNTHFSIQ